MNDPLLLFVDTETTGLDPDVDAVWELAWALTDYAGDVITSDCVNLAVTAGARASLNDQRLPLFDRAKTHARVDRPVDVCNAQDAAMETVRSAAQEAADGESHQVFWCGLTPSFDLTMLWIYNPSDLDPSMHYRPIDIGVWARAAYRLPLTMSSGDVLTHAGVKPTPEAERHTAEGDVELTRRLWVAGLAHINTAQGCCGRRACR